MQDKQTDTAFAHNSQPQKSVAPEQGKRRMTPFDALRLLTSTGSVQAG